MDRSSYWQLSVAEQAEFRAVRQEWRDWALANIGAGRDYWNGFDASAEAHGWRIRYESSVAPFVVSSQAVANALIQYAQAGLSKL